MKTFKKSNKKTLHPRNLHNRKYDYVSLISTDSNLKSFVSKNSHGDIVLDFENPKAVLALNKALLKHFYQIDSWSIPKGSMCPPIPGRADYIHYIADLLAENNDSKVPVGKTVKGLDVGVGANCIYPILGSSIYGWKFVGSDISSNSINLAKENVKANAKISKNIKCRFQQNSKSIFTGIIKSDEKFDFTMCNPPFHASKDEAEAATDKKNKGINNKLGSNFGGHGNELWVEGGEFVFIKQMIKESLSFKENCKWFTTLVSKKDNIEPIYKELEKAKAKSVRTIDMNQGNKRTRIIAWSFIF